MHLPAVVIRSSTEVDQCRQSRDAERHVDDAQTPWTPEGVGDDDADVDVGALADALANAKGARVRVIGQKSDDVGLTHIRLVDPGVCAYKAVPRLGYQHPMRAKYPHAFVEDHLDQARIRRCHQLRQAPETQACPSTWSSPSGRPREHRPFRASPAS